VTHDLEEAEERADMSESALNKVRSKSRYTAGEAGASSSSAGFSMSISRKVVQSSSSTSKSS